MKSPYSSLNDSQLQNLASKGDEEAFTVLFDRYWERLYCYAFRIFEDEKVCEDIVQELFIKLWERKNAPKILNLEGYFFRAVKYGIANHLRDLKSTSVHEEVLSQIPYNDNSSRKLEYQDFEKNILELINDLPPKCREVFHLSRFEHLSNPEISKKLNISIRTVETHISNAIKILKRKFPDYKVSLIIIPLLLEC